MPIERPCKHFPTGSPASFTDACTFSCVSKLQSPSNFITPVFQSGRRKGKRSAINTGTLNVYLKLLLPIFS